MAPVDPDKKPVEYCFDCVSFGRHQTFPLRYAWPTKGFQVLTDDPRTFDSDETTVTLGAEKNMVVSIIGCIDDEPGLADPKPNRVEPGAFNMIRNKIS